MTRNGHPVEVASPRPAKIWLRMVLGGLAVITACALWKYFQGSEPAKADSPWQQATPADPGTAPVQRAWYGGPAGVAAPARTVVVPASAVAPATRGVVPSLSSGKAIPQIVASVNGQQITCDELGRECILHHGRDVLDGMINKALIVQECQRQGVAITAADVDHEIQRTAKRFGLPVDQWLTLLKEERHLDVEQYAGDVVWPTLALRRLAGSRLKVSPEELDEYFEMCHGEKVAARLISCANPELAATVRAKAATHPEDFANLAKHYSEDVNSASIGGLIQPICRHGAYKEIEQTAFSLADGEVSKVIAVAGQNVILKRERLLPPDRVRREDVAAKFEEILREKKTHAVAAQVFAELKKRAQIEIVLEHPEKQQQLPGVAAVVNGVRITVRQLAEECIARHGFKVLEGLIGRKLIEQACQQQNVAVSQQEIDAEVARVASMMLRPLPDGSPDVQGFLKMVEKQEDVGADVYCHDAVWPSVALRKLVGGKIQITKEDMQNGYEANYGPRVRCRAIVLDQFRRAQQVWELARKRPTVENFGQLATEYSIEGASRSMEGRVPPIAKHNGQPTLEKEAFALRPGELSGVIQLGDKFVILFCEGYTTPEPVEYEKVRDLIRDDIREKKLHLAMSELLDHLQETAAVDNFLAGKSHAADHAPPSVPRGGDPGAARFPVLREVPARDAG
ncbi:MAG: peptidylprolyl isomerase [Thermoguttaceae bacterium]